MSRILGIDASNITSGGGLVHLSSILNSNNIDNCGFISVFVFSSSSTLNLLPDFPWLYKVSHPLLDKSPLFRFIWQIFYSQKSCRQFNVDVLFVPGGIYLGFFPRIVSMSQNMLPFNLSELFRYRFSKTTFRLLVVRLLQIFTFLRSAGVIFLTKFSSNVVTSSLPFPLNDYIIIPHGINPIYFSEPLLQNSIHSFSTTSPFSLVYVSIIDVYKHQVNVVKAISLLRANFNWPLQLNLIGPSYLPAFKRFSSAIYSHDPNHQWISYHGALSPTEISLFYKHSHLALFASSCENLPIILLEKMSSGLPVACANIRPMSDIFPANIGLFDPLNIFSIYKSLYSLISSPSLRAHSSRQSFKSSLDYSWNKCANETFAYLSSFTN
ncbi:MAG: glycosyltransferase family 4 protein [Synechococcus sp. MIT S9220]|uniref:glycosyltransferase n=1 Tax=Synechococcus sp. MIT S9220 TaxID=166309 RepID=UPI00180B3342|nr:glycosyltransferase family 4 protein [Synechococcus sp. MIT S9220]